MSSAINPANPQNYPLKLKAIMDEYGITQASILPQLYHRGGRSAGKNMSRTSFNHVINFGIYPSGSPESSYQEQIAEALIDKQVPTDVIEGAFEIDSEGANFEERNPGRTQPRDKQPGFTGNKTTQTVIQLPEPCMLSEATKKHFHLFQHPFQDDVQSSADVYLSQGQKYIRSAMWYAAKQGGFIAVVGESGSGKTTLRRDLISRINHGDESIICIQPQCIDKRRLTAAHICDAIIADLSHETPLQSLEAKSRQIQRILSDSSRAGNSHALIIEEAHDLSVSTLKYLKRFWELEDGFKRLIGIIMVGQPELGDRLDERKNYGAREVIRRCEVARLDPLNGNLEEYLKLKFKRIGIDLTQVFDEDAFDAIRARLTRRMPGTGRVESQMYPLNVHNVIIRAMNNAVELGYPKVNAELVEGV